MVFLIYTLNCENTNSQFVLLTFLDRTLWLHPLDLHVFPGYEVGVRLFVLEF